MRKGELLATAAVNSGHEQALRPVVLNVASNLPASTKVGDYVDLWIVPKEGVAGRPAAQAPPLRRPGRTDRTDRLLRAVKATNQDRPGEAKPAAWPQDWSSHRSVRPARG